GCVADQVDEHLLDLVRVGVNGDGGAVDGFDLEAPFERGRALNERADFDAAARRRGHARQAGIGLHETVERFDAAFNHTQALLHVLGHVFRKRGTHGERAEGAGDRFDGRKRVVKLVAENADEALPGLALFFAQGTAEVGDDKQLVRHAVFAKRGAAYGPASVLAGKGHLHGLGAGRLQEFAQAQLFRGETEHARGDASHELLAGAVDDAQALLLVKGEDGDVNFHHHLFEQGRGFERADLLMLKPYGESVNFVDEIGQG